MSTRIEAESVMLGAFSSPPEIVADHETYYNTLDKTLYFSCCGMWVTASELRIAKLTLALLRREVDSES